MNKSGWAGLDVIKGRRAIERRLKRGEQIDVLIYATIDPDARGHSDDGTSTQFTLTNVRWEEVAHEWPERPQGAPHD